MIQTRCKSKMTQFSYVETKRKNSEEPDGFSEEFHKCLKKWETCIASSDDRDYRAYKVCVCFKTQSHFFRDLNLPSPRPASKMCFIWPAWWFYLKIESRFQNQEISSTYLDFWCLLKNLKIWQNCSHNTP